MISRELYTQVLPFFCLMLIARPVFAQSEMQINEWIESVKAGDAAQQREAMQKIVLAGRQSTKPLLEAINKSTEANQQTQLLSVLGNLGVAAESTLEELKAMRFKLPPVLAEKANQAARQIEAYQDCGIASIPREAKLYFAGAYKGFGETAVNIRLGGNDHEVHQTDIVVSETNDPVVLVLAAYDPVVWKIGRVKGAHIAGVLVFGYEPQAVIGIEKSVPLRIRSSTQKGGNCPQTQLSYREPDIQAEMDLVRLTGLPLERVVRKGSGRLVVGPDSVIAEDSIIYSDEIPLEQYGRLSEVPAGEAGIKYLIEAGKLRQVTEVEWKSWKSVAPPQAMEDLHFLPHRGALLVLEQIEFPPGLYGAHSRIFVIPQNVAPPSGNPGHSQCLFLKDFSSGFCSK